MVTVSSLVRGRKWWREVGGVGMRQDRSRDSGLWRLEKMEFLASRPLLGTLAFLSPLYQNVCQYAVPVNLGNKLQSPRFQFGLGDRALR